VVSFRQCTLWGWRWGITTRPGFVGSRIEPREVVPTITFDHDIVTAPAHASSERAVELG
jgi:hypothetical protein